MKARVTIAGELILPASLKRKDAIKPGQQFDVERIRAGEYHLVRIGESQYQGFVDWLLDCPDKGYFVPIQSEPTGTR